MIIDTGLTYTVPAQVHSILEKYCDLCKQKIDIDELDVISVSHKQKDIYDDYMDYVIDEFDVCVTCFEKKIKILFSEKEEEY